MTAGSGGFLAPFNKVCQLASTVPSLHGRGNGDVNPYGVAVVPRSVGTLQKGDVLVSNFNDVKNLQGTGTTIMQVSPRSHSASVFANLAGQAKGPIGLTTALSAFRNGDVVVGSLPTTDGSAATATAGALYVLNSTGKLIETIRGPRIDGPWDMTAYDGGQFGVLFVSNVLRGTVAANGKVVHRGDVVRLVLNFAKAPPVVEQQVVIASGLSEETNPSALVIGPTGLGLARNGTLYLADTVNSRIASVPDALFRVSSDGKGHTVSSGGFLNAPLGLTVAPGGDVLSVNGGDGRIVETTPAGRQIEWPSIDQSGSPPGAGALFGLAVVPSGKGVYFVDDATNMFDIFR